VGGVLGTFGGTYGFGWGACNGGVGGLGTGVRG
jgi:hypothetical protein